MHKVILIEQERNISYEGQVDDSAVTLEREYGVSPAGNPFAGRWVLRIDGVYIDHDQYRTDLAERHNVSFQED